MSQITEDIAQRIKDSEPLTLSQCISCVSDQHSETEVRYELNATQWLNDNGHADITELVFDKATNRWDVNPRRHR